MWYTLFMIPDSEARGNWSEEAAQALFGGRYEHLKRIVLKELSETRDNLFLDGSSTANPGEDFPEDLKQPPEEVFMAKKVHIPVFEIRPREGCDDKISTGANTRVFMDGKPLGNCRSITVHAEAGKLTTIKLELWGILKAKVMGKPEVQVKTIEV